MVWMERGYARYPPKLYVSIVLFLKPITEACPGVSAREVVGSVYVLRAVSVSLISHLGLSPSVPI